MLYALIATVILEKRDDRPPAAMFAAIVCMAAADGIGRISEILQQRYNRKLAATDGRGYFVYLRSFAGKDMQSVTHSAAGANPFPNAMIVDDILSELIDSISELGYLFIIGWRNVGFAPSSPAVLLFRPLQDDWRRLFARLAKGARAIFVIPGVTPGVLEELTLLTDESVRRKMIVIMPPETGRDARRSTWRVAVASLAASKLQLPEFSADGMVYLAGEYLEPVRAIPYVIGGERQLARAIHSLVQSLPSVERSADVIDDATEIEKARGLTLV